MNKKNNFNDTFRVLNFYKKPLKEGTKKQQDNVTFFIERTNETIGKMMDIMFLLQKDMMQLRDDIIKAENEKKKALAPNIKTLVTVPEASKVQTESLSLKK